MFWWAQCITSPAVATNHHLWPRKHKMEVQALQTFQNTLLPFICYIYNLYPRPEWISGFLWLIQHTSVYFCSQFVMSLKCDQIILTSVLACTCGEDCYLLLTCDLLRGAVSDPCGRASGRAETSFPQCCPWSPSPKIGFPLTQKQAERMPLAMGERRTVVGHPPVCPTASTLGSNLMGAAGLRGHKWMWIIVRWDTGHQTAGEQMPRSASQGTACLKAWVSRWRWTGKVRDYVKVRRFPEESHCFLQADSSSE